MGRAGWVWVAMGTTIACTAAPKHEREDVEVVVREPEPPPEVWPHWRARDEPVTWAWGDDNALGTTRWSDLDDPTLPPPPGGGRWLVAGKPATTVIQRRTPRCTARVALDAERVGYRLVLACAGELRLDVLAGSGEPATGHPMDVQLRIDDGGHEDERQPSLAAEPWIEVHAWGGASAWVDVYRGAASRKHVDVPQSALHREIPKDAPQPWCTELKPGMQPEDADAMTNAFASAERIEHDGLTLVSRY